MKDRIKKIMDSEDMTPARFADTLQIGRAVISHILKGRNNPSLEVITRILSEMPHINSDWLLSGNGSMYKNKNLPEDFSGTTSYSVSPEFPADLFSQNGINKETGEDGNKYASQDELKSQPNTVQNIVNKTVVYKERVEKKISRIIIYYTDNTYETFNPENQ